MTDTTQTVLGARNDEALKNATERRDALQERLDAGNDEISLLAPGGPMHKICTEALQSTENKLAAAEKKVAKLSRTKGERKADQIALRDETSDAFESAGFTFHDTGADVGTVVWKQGPVRVTLRPDSPGYAKVAYAAGHVDDWYAFAANAAG